MKKISFILPVYNEEKNISIIYKEIIENFKKIEKNFLYEIIFVNDWSSDFSYFEIKKICEKDKNVKLINFTRNFWQQQSYLAWLKEATWDAIITMDSDLQDPVFVAFEMIKIWEKWKKIIYAKKTIRNENFFKKYFSIFYYKLLKKISKTKMIEEVWDFRLIDKEVLLEFLKIWENIKYIRWMFFWLWFDYEIFEFKRKKRKNWKSSYSIIKMLKLAWNWILSFSFFPLRISFFLGIIFFNLSIISTIYFFINFSVQNMFFSFIIGILWLQFFMIWIVWEYIWKLYDEVRDRPLYLIKEKINCEK